LIPAKMNFNEFPNKNVPKIKIENFFINGKLDTIALVLIEAADVTIQNIPAVHHWRN